MSDDRAVVLACVHANEKNPIACMSLRFWRGYPGQEAVIELTSPVAQRATLYVSAAEKARFIAELRSALDVWEKTL